MSDLIKTEFGIITQIEIFTPKKVIHVLTPSKETPLSIMVKDMKDLGYKPCGHNYIQLTSQIGQNVIFPGAEVAAGGTLKCIKMENEKRTNIDINTSCGPKFLIAFLK